MLKALHVKNLALIEEADISFDKGLNIISGETGAGKSILLESIHLALGGRSSKDFIRTGKEAAIVELTFIPESEEIIERLKERDIWLENDELIITRKITAEKSVLRINGETFSAVAAREIGDMLLDVHSQNEHQSLLKRSEHINILDKYAGSNALSLRTEIGKLYKQLLTAQKELEQASIDETAKLRELDFLEYQINEIDNSCIYEGEEEELSDTFRLLSGGQQIIKSLGNAHELFGSSISDGISDAASAVYSVNELDDDIKKIYEQILILQSEADDLSRSISDYMDSFNMDEEKLYETGKRLDFVRDILKKYGGSYSLMMENYNSATTRKNELINLEENREKLREFINKNKQIIINQSEKLHMLRVKAAKELEERIVENLRDLNFNQVEFHISVEQKKDVMVNGMDNVEFLISMNKGETAKQLDAVASGGELSRIMLALKNVLSEVDPIETQIFDEIDAGISGITASCVAKKLRSIGNNRQVLCISHLPQIVAGADHHYLIEKNVVEGRTFTSVTKLSEDGSVKELARILGGDQITELTLENAREMKRVYI